MEFSFNIHEVFKKQISKIDSTLLPDRYNLDPRRTEKSKKCVTEIINKMGVASSQAQGLQKVITTADKLKKSENVLYLLKGPKQNKQKGFIIGFIKVGKMKLFLHDLSNKLCEKEPLCILDFYVHETEQRRGYGKLLFEHMLSDQNIKPEKLAINRPSDSCSAFLRKHYSLSKALPQSNKFVIFEDFFSKPMNLLNFLNKTSTEMKQELAEEFNIYENRTKKNEDKTVKGYENVTQSVEKKTENPNTITPMSIRMQKTDYGSGFGENVDTKNLNVVSKNSPDTTKPPMYKSLPVKEEPKCHHSKHTPLW